MAPGTVVPDRNAMDGGKRLRAESRGGGELEDDEDLVRSRHATFFNLPWPRGETGKKPLNVGEIA